MLTVRQCATLACLLDVSIPKPGNVHRGADFENVTFLDFAASAVAIGPAMGDAVNSRLGETVWNGIRATRQVTSQNTNLGIVLLLAPLATVPVARRWQAGVADVLRRMDANDARHVYRAIRLAQPGGLGKTDEMDVRDRPPDDLLAAMRLAADRDLVAKQFVTDFEIVLHEVTPRLIEQCQQRGLADGVIDTFLWLMSTYPDSLIARKCGAGVAREAAARAGQARRAAPSDHGALLRDLDFWLRGDGNRRNPGTAADILTAALFVSLCDEKIVLRDQGDVRDEISRIC